MNMTKALEVYRANIWEEATEADMEEAFYGEYDRAHHIDDYLLEMYLDCTEVPAHLENYLDEAAIVRDMHFDYSVCEHEGKFYLFLNI